MAFLSFTYVGHAESCQVFVATLCAAATRCILFTLYRSVPDIDLRLSSLGVLHIYKPSTMRKTAAPVAKESNRAPRNWVFVKGGEPFLHQTQIFSINGEGEGDVPQYLRH